LLLQYYLYYDIFLLSLFSFFLLNLFLSFFLFLGNLGTVPFFPFGQFRDRPLLYISYSYIIMLNMFSATVSVLNILFPNVTILAPDSFNSFTSLSSSPPSGPITTAIFICSFSFNFNNSFFIVFCFSFSYATIIESY